MHALSQKPAEDEGRAVPAARRIVHQTRGHQQGFIARLVSPSDLGRLIKPFIFLDHFDCQSENLGGFPLHPHSGIATLTYMMGGEIAYEDSTGASGVLPTGGVEWMMAGGGVWHRGAPTPLHQFRGFQLWIAMPPTLESAAPYSMYLDPSEIPLIGPARLLLGRYQGYESRIPSPSPICYLGVRLAAGSCWHFVPPVEHDVAWLAVSSGELQAPRRVGAGELAIFEPGEAGIHVLASSDVEFVIGSAVKHPHELVMGYYSVHTSPGALRLGEARIREIGAGLGGRARASF